MSLAAWRRQGCRFTATSRPPWVASVCPAPGGCMGMYIPFLCVKEHVVMRRFLLFVSGVFSSLSLIDHVLSACVFREVVWCISVCKRVAQGEKQSNAFYFFAFRRPVLCSRPRVGSTFIHHIAAMSALSGRRQSEYVVPAAVKRTCTNYLSI